MKNKLKGYCEILEDHEQKSRIKEIIKEEKQKKITLHTTFKEASLVATIRKIPC